MKKILWGLAALFLLTIAAIQFVPSGDSLAIDASPTPDSERSTNTPDSQP